MKKLIFVVTVALAVPAFFLTSCGGSGCDDLKAKLEACGAMVSDNCTDDSAAACTADKLNEDCSNLIEAASSCA